MDFSQYSDEELMKAAGIGRDTDLSQVSDEELQAAAGIKKEPKYNQLQSYIQGAAQGASANFGDEIMAGLTAPVMYAGSRVLDVPGMSDKTLGEIYSQERGKIAGENQIASEDNPWSYGLGGVTGAIGTGVAGSATKAGTAIANSLRAGNLPLRIAKGAIAGAASGELYGAGASNEGERLAGAAEGGKYGALVGGAIPAIGAALGGIKNAVLPKAADEETARLAQVALDEGIPLRRSQVGNSRFAKALASTTNEIPFSGSEAFNEKQLSSFNSAVLKKAGINADKATPEVLQNAVNDFNTRFSSAIGKTGVEVNEELLDGLGKIEAEASRRLGKDATPMVSSIIDDVLASGKIIDGQTYQNTRSMLGQQAKTTQDAFLAKTYKDMQKLLDDAAFKSLDLSGKQEWQQLRKQYGAFKTIEKAMTNSGAEAAVGNVSPAQLAIAAKSSNKAYARGAGELNELARIGGRFVRDNVPNSGTPGRLAAYGTLTAGPAALLGGGTGALTAPLAGIGMSRAFNALDTAQPIVRNALTRSGAPVTSIMSVPAGAAAGQIAAEREAMLRQAMKMSPAEARKLLQKK